MYLTERKYDEAIAILEESKQKYPKNAQLFTALGAVQRRKGLWRESIESYNKALMLDSNNANLNYEAARLYDAVREYDKAILYWHKAGARDYSYGALFRQGALTKALSLIEEFFKKSGKQGDLYQAYYYKREFRNLLDLVDETDEYYGYPRALWYSEIYYLMNDVTSAKKYALQAVESLSKKSKKSPDDYNLLGGLGLAYAYSGECENAIAAGRKALQLMPISRDAFKMAQQMNYTLPKFI